MAIQGWSPRSLLMATAAMMIAHSLTPVARGCTIAFAGIPPESVGGIPGLILSKASSGQHGGFPCRSASLGTRKVTINGKRGVHRCLMSIAMLQGEGGCCDKAEHAMTALRPSAARMRVLLPQQRGRCFCPGCIVSSLAAKSTAGRGGEDTAREEEGMGEGEETARGDPTLIDDAGGGEEAVGGAKENSKVVEAMLSALRGYKKLISPLLPPSCRFLPTCSIYAMESIQTFGPVKGVALTAWRLARCSPLHWGAGGKGYDPPKWPPVPYNYHWP